MLADNKAVVRRFTEEILNKSNWAVADEIFAPDFVYFFAGSFEPMDRASFRQTLLQFRGGFPDIQFTIEEIFGEEDKIAVRYLMRGTHRGEFQGIPPTGKSYRWAGIAVFHLAAGKLVEEWPMPDVLGLLRQLGATSIPSLATVTKRG